MRVGGVHTVAEARAVLDEIMSLPAE